MDVGLGAVCCLCVLLQCTQPHLTAATEPDEHLVDSVLSVSHDLPQRQTDEATAGLSGSEHRTGQQTHLKHLSKLLRHRHQLVRRHADPLATLTSRASKRDGRTVNRQRSWRWLLASPVPSTAPEPAVFTRPSQAWLPSIYWLWADSPSYDGADSLSREDQPSPQHSAVDVYIAGTEPSGSATPSQSPLLTVLRSQPSAQPATERRSPRHTPYPTPGTPQGETLYSTPGRRSATPSGLALRATTSSVAVTSTGQAVTRYPTPGTTVPLSIPTPGQRQVEVASPPLPTLSPATRQGGLTLTCADGRCLHPAFNTRLSDAWSRIRYDDNPTVSPSRQATPSPTLAPRPSYRQSVLRAGSRAAPTAAPHTRAPVPTVAPALIHWQTEPPSPATASTTAYPRPTPRVEDTPAPTLMTEKRTGPPTSRPETVCLQYLSVQHDVDCGQRVRRSDRAPSVQHLKLLLQYYGVSASSPFTAPTRRDADVSFRNLLPLGVDSVDEHIHLKFTSKQLQTLLEKHYSTRSSPQSTWSSHEATRASSLRPDDQQLPFHFLQQMVPLQHLAHNTTHHRNRRTVNATDGPSVAARSSANGYCQRQTAPATFARDQRAHLCTQCQETRHLGDNVFPTYIQEVVCYPSDAPCLSLGGSRAQGQCQETYIPITVLRLNPGRCMRVNLTNGQSLVFDDWRMAQQMVQTGCQCMVDKRSPIAANLQ